MQARDFVTRNPKHVNETDPPEVAIVKMEKYRITHLFVVNSLLKPVGVIHIHDIVEGTIVEKQRSSLASINIGSALHKLNFATYIYRSFFSR